ncbi:unnamed protein product [Amaranthus hypochondriacus]
MGEEFLGGVCGDTWWNPPHNLFSGSLSSPCSVAQLGGGGGFDMDSFGWQNDVTKSKLMNNNTIFDNLIFQDEMDSSLDILSFCFSPTSSNIDWNHQNLICNSEKNENNFGTILQENMNSNNHEDGSPSIAMTSSSNNSSDSSTITYEGTITTSFPINSSASYLIQSLFDDFDDQSQAPQSQSIPHHDHQQFINPSNFNSLDSTNHDHHHHQNPNQSPDILSQLQNNEIDEKINSLMNNCHEQILGGHFSPTTLDNIRASLMNSLQSRSRGPTSSNQKSKQSCGNFGSKVKCDSKSNCSSKDQPQAKRPRIETPSPLPTFKVRKEKLGDRITALQQLVSPFGKTDTASVLHEAIDYIKFLHDQVNVLSTSYLKSGTAIQQQGYDDLKNNEEGKQDLRSKGLCVLPISSTYPMAQETPVDFWTPTFGGTTFR